MRQVVFLLLLFPLVGYGQTFEEEEDRKSLQKTLAYYNRAINADPGDALNYKGRGEMKELLGDPAGAVADYRLAIDKGYQPAAGEDSSAARVFIVVGQDDLSQENHSGALQRFNRALVIRPNDPQALVGKGDALIGLGRQSAACESYSKAQVAGADVGAKTGMYCD